MTMELYDACVAAGLEIDHHESDLYVKKTPAAIFVLSEFNYDPELKKLDKYRGVSTFKSSIDGSEWFDIPFAYLPWWRERGHTKEKDGEGRLQER